MTTLSRRNFLGAAAGAGLAVALNGSTPLGVAGAAQRWGRIRFSGPPFALGVASGDPGAHSVVLWTRLAPEPTTGGGVPARAIPVQWEVATDERLQHVVRRGSTLARPEHAHSVHVLPHGLDPGRWYWYRFKVADEISPVGRTRTTPRADASPPRLDFAFASCQSWESGFYPAHGHLAEEDIDAVVFLGDYIYENGPGTGGVRQHEGPEAMTLAGYRNRYGQYKGDPKLQAAHAAFPWLLVQDDHEVDNNYADEVNQGGLTPEQFLARRAAAYKAWWEHQPVRLPAPTGPDYRIFRRSSFGDLARFHLLDTRQHRTPQPCGGIAPPCEGTFDPDATMTGAAQERWLREGLDGSPARWNVLAQQTIFSKFDVLAGPAEIYNDDQWDGYFAARDRLLSFLDRRRPSNPVVITGDVHASGAGDIKADFDDVDSATVGSEYVGAGISSQFPEAFVPIVEAAVVELPYAKYFEGRKRGYVRCRLTRNDLRVRYRYVTTSLEPESPIENGPAFVTENGSPGVHPL